MAHLPAAIGGLGRGRRQISPAIVLLLIAMTITAYWRVGRCGFVNLDDDAYVFQYEGRQIKLCCDGCKKDFDKEPAKFIKKLEDAEKNIKK